MEIYPNGYPVFKGLQKPLEFMGIRGRFLFYIAGAIAIGFLGYLICSFVVGQVLGLIFLTVISVCGYGGSFFLQRKGLHSKKKDKSTLIVKTLFSK